MTPEEIQAMAKGLAEGQAVWYVLSACIGGAIAGLGTYLAEKGKNRATKEDIGQITRAVKEIEAGFNEKLADLQAHHQLRMVAAERRMQAHQEAYKHWHTLVVALNSNVDISDLVTECQAWYVGNCIFLGEQSRTAFTSAWASAMLLRTERGRVGDIYMRSWDKLDRAGNVFLEEAGLPPMAAADRPHAVATA